MNLLQFAILHTEAPVITKSTVFARTFISKFPLVPNHKMSSQWLKNELDAEFAVLDKKAGNNKTHAKKKTDTSVKLRDRLPTSRHGVKKSLDRLKRENRKSKKNRITDVGAKVSVRPRIVADETTDRSAKVEESLRALMAFSDSKVKAADFEAVHRHNLRVKRKLKADADESVDGRQKSKHDKSVFSDEDFAAFSSAYFINSKVTKKSNEDEDKPRKRSKNKDDF